MLQGTQPRRPRQVEYLRIESTSPDAVQSEYVRHKKEIRGSEMIYSLELLISPARATLLALES